MVRQCVRSQHPTYQVGNTVLGLTTAACSGSLALVRDRYTDGSSDLGTLESDLASEFVNAEQSKRTSVDRGSVLDLVAALDVLRGAVTRSHLQLGSE